MQCPFNMQGRQEYAYGHATDMSEVRRIQYACTRACRVDDGNLIPFCFLASCMYRLCEETVAPFCQSLVHIT